MADVQAQPDGSAQVTVNPVESAGLKAVAALHLPALKRAAAWFSADVAPEIGDAAAFLETLAGVPPEGTVMAVSAPQVQVLRGLLGTHLSEFQQVLAVVESPAVRAMVNLAKSLL